MNVKTGTLKFNFPDLEPHEMSESCVLDVAGADGSVLIRVGELLNLTRERVRQLEESVLEKLAQWLRDYPEKYDELKSYVEEESISQLRLPGKVRSLSTATIPKTYL